MVRSKRLKQTKHKIQTKNRRQTKHKRHRQYGGVLMTYRDYSREFGFNSNNLVIPGYEDIVSMIDLYENGDVLKKNLDEGIKRKVDDIKYIEYTKCKLPEPSTTLDLIIVLKKKGFINFSKGIECLDTVYTELASHNFKIFIEEILNWNPFLNIPKRKLPSVSNWYGYEASYNGLSTFRDKSWWDSQSWWTTYSQTSEFREAAEAAARTVAPAAEAEAAESKKRLVENLKREIEELNSQMRTIQTKIQVKTVELQNAEQQLQEQ